MKQIDGTRKLSYKFYWIVFGGFFLALLMLFEGCPLLGHLWLTYRMVNAEYRNMTGPEILLKCNQLMRVKFPKTTKLLEVYSFFGDTAITIQMDNKELDYFLAHSPFMDEKLSDTDQYVVGIHRDTWRKKEFIPLSPKKFKSGEVVLRKQEGAIRELLKILIDFDDPAKVIIYLSFLRS
jgi:hypothetical protein